MGKDDDVGDDVVLHEEEAMQERTLPPEDEKSGQTIMPDDNQSICRLQHRH